MAKDVAALSGTAILALVILLLLMGKLHTDGELAATKSASDAGLLYREVLRKEAIDDRRASDTRVEKLSDNLYASTEQTKRALDLIDAMLEERPVKNPLKRSIRG